MSPLGKLVAAGVAVVAGTSLLTGVTTAYMLRPSTPPSEPAVAAATVPVTPAPRPLMAAPRRVTSASPTWEPPRATRVSAPASTECTAGDRAVSIAKPGALGTLLGAGLGAAGGAIANGGKGAGKGALIGGIAGAAVGTGYGAYKVKNECGTILG